MKLHSPQFQRKLRRGVRKIIRGSRELRKEYRQAKKFRKHVNAWWFIRSAFSLGFGAGVMAAVKATGHPASGLAFIALWSFAWIFFLTQNLWIFLHTHLDIMALRLLPVSDATIFRWQLQKFSTKTIFALLDLSMGFAALGLWLNFATSQWVFLPLIIILSWLTLLALVVLCATIIPRRIQQITPGAIWISGFLLFLALGIDGKAVLSLLDQIAPDLTLILPTGWPVLLFQLLLPGSSWIAILALVPVVVLLISFKNSITRLQNDVRYKEYILPMAPDTLTATNAQDSPPADQAPAPHNLGLTAIEEIILSRQFLEPLPWSQLGWFERQLWNWFDAREKALSEFVFPKGFKITVPWWKTVRNLAVAVAAAMILGMIEPTSRNWIIGVGLFLTILQALAQILNNGTAFRQMFCSGVNIPVYAGYGLGYRELSRFLLKCSAIQLPLFIPFITLCGVLATWLSELPWQMGIILGFKAGILLSAGRFMLILFAFSGGTNDGSKYRLRTVVLVVALVSLCLIFMGLGAAGLFATNTPAAWGLLALAVLTAYASFRTYGWFYHANRFDLMSLPRR
ncbi:MAG TPA: hypothetical protein VMJ12_03975 [Candidatus Acidoferrales bacterium]|nr:hypothetical protein [Candidatus Acidoferrales bacterium]